MPHAFVSNVVIATQGSTLVADAAVDDTQLLIEWAGSFAVKGGTLELNDARLAYTAADPAAGVIELAEPLAAPAEAGDQVTVITAGQPEVSRKVHVDFVDGTGSAIVRLPSTMDIRFHTGPEYYVENPMVVELDRALTKVVDVVDQVAPIEGEHLNNPLTMGFLLTPQEIANDTLTTILWAVLRADDFTYDPLTGRFFAQRPGVYDYDCTVRFPAVPGASIRLLQSVFQTWGAGTFAGTEDRRTSTDDDSITLSISGKKPLLAGEAISFQTLHRAGFDLNINASDTNCSILRAAAA